MKAVFCGAMLFALLACNAPAATAPVGAGSAVLGRAAAVTRAGSAGIELPSLEKLAYQNSEDGTRFLLLSIKLDAPAARLRFTDFRVPLDARVFVYGVQADGTVVDTQGPFTGAGPADTHAFWTEPLRGNVMIEFQTGNEILADLPFTLAEIRTETAPVLDTWAAVSSTPAEVRTAWFRDRNVAFTIRDGMAVLEGDIDLGPVDLLEPPRAESKSARRDGIGVTATRYRWPNGVMPYVIDPAVTYRQAILDAVAHWNNTLGGVVRVVPRTSQANYIQFKHNSGSVCSSNVGMLGYGMQNVNLSSACGFGAIVHEIGHALGLFHEQSREDRDSHVRILFENISSNQTYNFAQSINNADDLGAYDFNSIMHYNAYAFSANGRPTIETIPAGIPIGQRSGLSTGDVNAIKTLYGAAAQVVSAPTSSFTVASNPVGLQLLVDGSPVTTPYTAEWVVGSEHTVSAPATLMINTTRHSFHRWSDAAAATHTITTPAEASMLIADYQRLHRVSATVAGGGTVSVSPASGDSYYAENSVVTLTAEPVPGSCFAGWTGLLGGTPSVTNVTVTKEYAVTANFVSGSATVNRTADWFPRLGGELDLTVASAAGCGWSAASDVSWIRVIGGPSGTGPGTTRIAVDANATRMLRMGRVRIGTSGYLVVQTGF